MSGIDQSAVIEEITRRMSAVGVQTRGTDVRAYPDETNFIIYVSPEDTPQALEVSLQLDEWLKDTGSSGFFVIRKLDEDQGADSRFEPLTNGVADNRVDELVRLISARSRVSESQPSLFYVRDSQSNLATISAPRHHLIFGRRGAGKSALLTEAKRLVDEAQGLSSWTNLQTLRREDPRRVFLYVIDDVLSRITARLDTNYPTSAVTVASVQLADEIATLLNQSSLSEVAVDRSIPKINRLLRRALELLGLPLYVFVDDFYYVARSEQPAILDMLHGCVRDCDAWLKIASIRHLTRWFESSPPTGLQTGQDADILDLDVTLQDPQKAKDFLENVFSHYATRARIPRLTSIFNANALDRLILASGAVPRDYLVLCAAAIRKAQGRANARLVGAQDVNQAAGDAAQVKIQELEDDLASNHGTAARTLTALQRVRSFCLEQTETTYFRVDFKDKEAQPLAYNVLADLLDVRLIHLLDSSVSEAHAAGERSEAYMLDLSQFSGSRLKQGIRVVDFRSGKLVSHKTRVKDDSVRVGNTARQVLTILRTAPLLGLDEFADLVS